MYDKIADPAGLQIFVGHPTYILKSWNFFPYATVWHF